MKTRILSLISLLVIAALLTPTGAILIAAAIEDLPSRTLADASPSTAQTVTTYDCATATGIPTSENYALFDP